MPHNDVACEQTNKKRKNKKTKLRQAHLKYFLPGDLQSTVARLRLQWLKLLFQDLHLLHQVSLVFLMKRYLIFLVTGSPVATHINQNITLRPLDLIMYMYRMLHSGLNVLLNRDFANLK